MIKKEYGCITLKTFQNHLQKGGKLKLSCKHWKAMLKRLVHQGRYNTLATSNFRRTFISCKKSIKK